MEHAEVLADYLDQGTAAQPAGRFSAALAVIGRGVVTPSLGASTGVRCR
jgi:hypothetical protein